MPAQFAAVQQFFISDFPCYIEKQRPMIYAPWGS